MANTTNKSARMTHVSPGVYTREVDLTYASKSLGITTLGVAGETLKGPAFQPIKIENWRDFIRYFGGTSIEKFRGSQYPKYELPYIAQSYLKQSEQLEVVRVLGLSGVNAGPAWVLSVTNGKTGDEKKTYVIGVIRSRGEHRAATAVGVDECNNQIYKYDAITYFTKKLEIEPSNEYSFKEECNQSESDRKEKDFSINALNYGTFVFKVTTVDGETKKYSVSLTPGNKNYIYNVIGGDPENGDAEIYVEELYDVALKQLIEEGSVSEINNKLVCIPDIVIKPKFAPVNGLLSRDESTLGRKDIGKRFVAQILTKDGEIFGASVDDEGNPLKVSKKEGNNYVSVDCTAGKIYYVTANTTAEGTREYRYVEALDKEGNAEQLVFIKGENQGCYVDINTGEDYQPTDAEEVPFSQIALVSCVYNNEDGAYYVMDSYGDDDLAVLPIGLDFNNYKEQYRFASTPWVVSEVKGEGDNIELTKLFRFHTISDGDASNTEVKISIENIDPSDGTFDVLVRDFYDVDSSKAVIERFRRVNLIPGDKNYIAYRIGSFDDSYANVSTYITVEVNETDRTMTSVPAGFLGYPIRNYGGTSVSFGEQLETFHAPILKYNTNVDEDIRINKQYFGLSNITGIDEDILKYKGVEAYTEGPVFSHTSEKLTLDAGLTPAFHLDSRILTEKEKEDNPELKQTVMVDGVEYEKWSTVGKGNTVSIFDEIPVIGTEEEMANTIYEDKRYRKFTLCFYGGFDGWDYYRTSRSNADEYRYNKYRGALDYNSGEGVSFSVIRDPENYGFDNDAKILNTDYYAYLSAIRQFANPKTIDINVFATPGIDYVNNRSLVEETITMIEEERADSVYVVTTPDKPFGASDSQSEMFSAQDAVDNLDDAEIDSNYTCSYFPWVKYFDNDNSQYIYLPPTRDVVRNFAYTDNTKYPWFAAAGWDRGDMESDAINPKKILKLAEQDELYDGRLNFINNFASDGMKIWGDKNFQVNESQMNRISKRRLLLRIRKLCAIAAIGLLFDPNDNTTAKAFESAVTPVLNDVMSKRGITDWRLEIDDSQEARDRLELNANIYIKPTPNLEYINISFIITPQGVAFDDI